MARYIDADKFMEELNDAQIEFDEHYKGLGKAKVMLSLQPTADVVEVETIKAWLYEMAINNVGCVIDGDFSKACEEIISRIDGSRNFAKERSEGDG